MDREELKNILKLHVMWLEEKAGGQRANLTGANLTYADLTRANLTGANLTYADLTRANLTGANLTDAYLARANLTGANLTGADLTRANLTGANLTDAYLARANLTGANLTYADLTRANLTGANLTDAYLARADLTDAYLVRANLTGANLTGANLTRAYLTDEQKKYLTSVTSILPMGTIIGFKKVRAQNLADEEIYQILRLEIAADIARLNAIGSRKCRANSAKVLEVVDSKKYPRQESKRMYSGHTDTFEYRVGEIVTSEFDDDVQIECSKGIHFFITQLEAEEYEL